MTKYVCEFLAHLELNKVIVQASSRIVPYEGRIVSVASANKQMLIIQQFFYWK